MPGKDLLLVSPFRVCSSTDPGKLSVQYIYQFRKAWPLNYLYPTADQLKVKIIYRTH